MTTISTLIPDQRSREQNTCAYEQRRITLDTEVFSQSVIYCA